MIFEQLNPHACRTYLIGKRPALRYQEDIS